jgi:hypothetical protein
MLAEKTRLRTPYAWVNFTCACKHFTYAKTSSSLLSIMLQSKMIKIFYSELFAGETSCMLQNEFVHAQCFQLSRKAAVKFIC